MFGVGQNRRTRHLFSVAAAVLSFCASVVPAQAQSTCYTQQRLGGAATRTVVTGVEDVGTSPAYMNVLAESPTPQYYQLSTFAGPASVTIATALVSGPMADNDKAPLGITFINGSANDIKIRQVVVQSDRTGGRSPLFRSSPKPTNIDPLVGSWDISTDKYDAIWTAPAGGLTVPAKSAQAFLANIFTSNVGAAILNDLVQGTITPCANLCNGTDDLGTYGAQGYLTDLYTPSGSNKVATAMVAFVDSGSFPRTTTQGTYGPPSNLVGGQASTITARVQEWSGNQAIAAGLQMTLTLPQQWTNVSVTSAGAPWNLASAVVSGSSAAGWTITISTNATIAKGNSSGDIVIAATPPVVYTKSAFQSKISLNGFDTSGVPAGGHVIRSVCDGGGTILPIAGGGSPPVLNVEFLSPRLNAGPSNAPVEQVDFRADVNMINNSAPLSVTAEAYNFTTSAWQTITGTPVTLTSSNSTISQSFSGTTLFDLLDSQMRMRVRFVTSAGGAQTLRFDYMIWDVPQTYWAVDNSPGVGNDNWPAGTRFPGSSRYPFATIAKAASVVTGSEHVQVLVGTSQSGTAYAGNIGVAGAGTDGSAACKTWFEGVSTGAQLPRIRGLDPTADAGFDIAANHVKVSGFRIENMLVALVAENPSGGIVFDSNSIQAPTFGYGILLNNYSTPAPPATGSSGLQVTNNTIDGTGFQPFMGIYDAGAQAALIDGNKIIAFPNFGMYLDGASSPTIQRNVVTGGYFGIYLARTTGAKLYNNSIDMNSYRGVYCQASTGVVSRNNIISRNPSGISTDTANSVDSNYDDVWSSVNPYLGLTAGANSLSVDPLFVQTATPSLPTYYKLNAGSQCIDNGVNVGLPFLGLKPDLGAVESQ